MFPTLISASIAPLTDNFDLGLKLVFTNSEGKERFAAFAMGQHKKLSFTIRQLRGLADILEKEAKDG